MALRTKVVAFSLTFLGVGLHTDWAKACGSGETEVYRSATTVFCVNDGVTTMYGPIAPSFFAWGDTFVRLLPTLLNITPPSGVFTIEASAPNGVAHTGSECCGTGMTVTGDAFFNSSHGVKGFYGYLLPLHETINDYLLLVGDPWSTDWWVDHTSAYPNSMDSKVMAVGAMMDSDPLLAMAATAHQQSWYPGGANPDPRVVAFDNVFQLSTMGFAGWTRVFKLFQADKISDNIAPNPSMRRSEYEIAYVSLGAGQSLLPVFQTGLICNGMPDTANPPDPTYMCNEADIDAIANAHCAAAANGHGSADVSALSSGQYANVKPGPCGPSCPTECGCQMSTMNCVAPWVAGNGGPEVTDGGSASSSGGTSGPSDAGSGSSGSGGSGGGSSDAGASSGASSGTGGSSGGGNASSGSGASLDSGGGSGTGAGGSDAATNGDFGTPQASSGCGCATLGTGESRAAALLVGPVLVGLVLARKRSRRRGSIWE